MKAAFTVLLSIVALVTSQSQSAQAQTSLNTQVRGKILMADCSRILVEASSRDLKDQCVVIYSGVWTLEGKEGLTANSADGNIGFAKESSGVLDLVGKHVQMDINLANGRIKSVEIPD